MNFPSALLMVVLAMAVAYPLGLTIGFILGLVSTAATKLLYLGNEDELAPRRRGGRRSEEPEAPDLSAIWRARARRAAVPVPTLYVIESPERNAVAAGRDPRHAAICVTTGLLRALTRDELTAVLAHELAHVLHRSSVTKTVAATLTAAISLLPPFGIFFGLGIAVSLLLTIATPLAAVIVQLAIARVEEYAADERGARLTGRPDVAAGVLARIALVEDGGSGNAANSAIATVLLAIGKWLAGPRRDNPFSGYPLPANRIAALARLSCDIRPGEQLRCRPGSNLPLQAVSKRRALRSRASSAHFRT
jgi:heat shock protein HtpX